MRWIFHKGYDYGRWLPLPRRIHGFVRDKPSRMRRFLLARGAVRPDEFIIPAPVSETTLAAVHSPGLIAGLSDTRAVAEAAELALLARLPRAVVRHAVVKPQLLAAGGTCAAVRHAANGAWVVNLSGGYHHARPGLSHGFCLVNDVAMAVHELHESGVRPRIVILDLDLHQGDGNAACFAEVADVWTASMHQESAFPVPKLQSDFDVPLPDGTADDDYLTELDGLLGELAELAPALIVYVAGTDPFEHDAIGSLRLSRAGMLERDRRVARFARDLGAGLVVLPAGGYSEMSPEIAASGYIAIARSEVAHHG